MTLHFQRQVTHIPRSGSSSTSTTTCHTQHHSGAGATRHSSYSPPLPTCSPGYPARSVVILTTTSTYLLSWLPCPGQLLYSPPPPPTCSPGYPARSVVILTATSTYLLSWLPCQVRCYTHHHLHLLYLLSWLPC